MERSRTYDAPESAPRQGLGGTGAAGFDEPAANGGAAPAEAFKEAASRFAELKEYAGYYVAAKADSIKVTLRNIAIYAVLGIVGGIVGLGFLITAVVLLLNGLAGAVGAMFNPDRPWAGDLIVGLLLVGGAAAAVIYGLKSITGSSRKRTIEKYENRKRDERNVYGHDVQDRAAEQERVRQQQQTGA